jgi:arylsulfatase B
VLPTLIDLCHLDAAQAEFDGRSLAPLLRGQAQPELRERMIVVQYGGLNPTQPQAWDGAVLWNQWRLVGGEELYDVASDPGQSNDVAGRHPDVVRRMRGHYESWWGAVAPSLQTYERITLGSDRENPVRLSSLDWLASKLVPAAQPFDIRQLGVPVVEGSLPLGRPIPVMHGAWNVEVARQGTYRVSLRRWPQEANAALTAPLPEYHGVDGVYPAGKALPVAAARLQVGPIDVSTDVESGAKAAEFTVRLTAGPARLQTWFLDKDGAELCGAFYVQVLRLP